MSLESILIIGGTGFIGRNLVSKSIQKGYQITILSKNSPSQSSRIIGAEYIQCDIGNFNQLKEKLTRTSYDFVINLAGYVDHSKFLDGGINVLDAHLFGVINILRLIDWKELKLFVQIGSSDEYGNSVAPQNETMSESSISTYSYGKKAATDLLKMLNKTEAFPIVVFRLFLVYGPGQNSERFIPQVINGCISGDTFPVSKGEQLRDFCYIDDVTSGILSALHNKKVIGQVINLGSGNPTSIRKIIEKIVKLIGMGQPDFGHYQYRVNENMKLYADIKKAKKILDWNPKIGLEEGLKKTILEFK